MTPNADYEARSAMGLTEAEWNCLRGIASFYLATDGGADDSLELCRRIIEATDPSRNGRSVAE